MEKVFKGAVFFDVDGTLISAEVGQKPTEKTLYALSALQQKGYMVGVATGRAKCYVPEMGIPFDCYVTSNGAYAEVDGAVICNHCFPLADLQELTAAMEELGVGYSMEGPEKCLYSEDAAESFAAVMREFKLKQQCFFPLQSLEEMEANKLNLAYDEPWKYDALVERFGKKYNFAKHHHSQSADLNMRDMNKSVGILKVVERFHLPLDQVYAFGDGENDYEMLSAVGHGVVMGDHAARLDRLKDKMITDTVKNEGVYNGLRRLGLID